MFAHLRRLFHFNPPHFLITSTGYSGSWWLASSLHLHPEVKCSMGVDALPAAFDYYYNQNEITKIFRECPKWLDHGVLFPRYFSIMLDKLEKNGFITTIESNQYREQISKATSRNIDDLYLHIFNELESTPFKRNPRVSGNVHGLSATQFKAALANKEIRKSKFNPKRIPVFDLIRNPITRLDTFINYKCQWYETEKYSSSVKINVDNCLNEMADKVKQIETLHHVDFSITRNKVFFLIEQVNSHLLMNFNDVINTPEIPRITFESIRNDQDYFKNVFKKVTGGLEADKDYLDLVFSKTNLSQGRASETHLQVDRNNPESCFNSWSDWEKSRFRERARENNFINFYSQYNYDLSFIEK